jgi:LysM repeat protein
MGVMLFRAKHLQNKKTSWFAWSVLLFLLCPLCLPAQDKSTDVRTIDGQKFYIHKTEKKQSLYAISKLYNVSVDELLKYNPEVKSGLKAKQELKIPFAAQQNTVQVKPVPVFDSTKYVIHRAEKKETIFSICKRYNIPEKQLLIYNPSLAEGLKEGQLLIVGERQKPKLPVKEISKENRLPREKIQPAVIDTAYFRPVSKPAKLTYNVALMLPFRLNQSLNLNVSDLVKTNASFPQVSSVAIDFYLGFKKAVDSIISKDFEVNLLLYDVDDSDSLRPVQIASDPLFGEHDFIFGPFYASGFKVISKKARECSIPVVSPITQQNKILHNNIFISKTNPSQYTLLETLADYCADSLMTDNSRLILVTSEKDRKELQFSQAFKKYYNDRQKNLGRAAKDTVTVAKGFAGVKSAVGYGMKNVVVTLSANQVFIADFTTQLALLAGEKNELTLCGWEAVGNMDNIDQEYLNQLHFTFASACNLNNTDAYKVAIEPYKEQLETSPDEYYYKGFDIATYYLNNLKTHGPQFIHRLDEFPSETNYMRFRFIRPDKTTGFDNRGAYIFRYENYRLRSTGWK